MNYTDKNFNIIEVKAMLFKTTNDMLINDNEQAITWSQGDKIFIAGHPDITKRGIAVLGQKGTAGASPTQFPLTLTDQRIRSLIQVTQGNFLGKNFEFFRNILNTENDFFEVGNNLTPEISAVSIMGTADVGLTLSLSYLYDGKGITESGTTYQWKRDGVNIVGATNSTYTMQVDDIKKQLSCEVTPRNIAGNVGISKLSQEIHGGTNIYSLFQNNLLDGDSDGLADDGANPPTTEIVNSTSTPANTATSIVAAGTEGHTRSAQRITSTTGTNTLVLTLRNVAGGVPNGKSVRIYFKISKPNTKTLAVKWEGNIDLNPAHSTTTNYASATQIQIDASNSSGVTKHLQFRLNSAAVGENFTISEIEMYYTN